MSNIHILFAFVSIVILLQISLVNSCILLSLDLGGVGADASWGSWESSADAKRVGTNTIFSWCWDGLDTYRIGGDVSYVGASSCWDTLNASGVCADSCWVHGDSRRVGTCSCWDSLDTSWIDNDAWCIGACSWRDCLDASRAGADIFRVGADACWGSW